jgi:UDP-N-acetylglucosamine:LPS N-acetylglucosamine transferase
MNQDMKSACESFGKVIDRADQSTMGSLYQRADICICRGGTTSLAEMQIFGVRKLIIPLPITHDQQANAEYYVNNYGDHLIMQDQRIISNLEK